MRKLIIVTAVFVLSTMLVGKASAAPGSKTFNWWNVPVDPRWTVADNWTPPGVPTSNDFVYIESDGGPVIDANMVGANSAKAFEMFVGTTAGTFSDANLTMTGGALTTTYNLVFALSSGVVDAVFNLSGGTVNLGTNLYLGDNGGATLNISGGTITAPRIIAATGTTAKAKINITGGQMTATNAAYIGDHGDANCVMSNGTVSFQTFILGTWWPGPAVFNLEGGSLSVPAYAYIGDHGRGVLNVSGGTFDVNNTLIIAAWSEAVGTVNLTSGNVNVKFYAYVGDNGKATLNISGGLFTCSGLSINNNSSVVNMSGSGLLKIKGDHRDLVNSYINLGKIAAVGVRTTLKVDYASGPDETVISVVSIDAAQASNPSPSMGASVDRVLSLSWLSGDGATWHDVYLSTNYDDVNNLNAEAFKQRLPAGTVSYNPGLLALDTIYYWRVNEIADGNVVTNGPIWTFTVLPYATVDGFENYTDDDALWQTWIDAFNPSATKNTGSEIFLVAGESNSYSGNQAMSYKYDLSGTYNADYYAEIERSFVSSQDWASDGVVAMDIWYKGLSTNAAEQIYVGLEDTRGEISYAEVRGPNDFTSIRWQVWHIKLSEFTGVDLAHVEKMYIGFGSRTNTRPAGTPGGIGTVLIDDIRLYKSRCIADISGLAADFNGDCTVNLTDMAIFANSWLTPTQIPGTTGLVAYWPLDGDVNDASGNLHNGVIHGEPKWVSGRVGNALTLDGVDDYVEIANSPAFDFGDQMTVSCLVKVSFVNPWETPISKDGEQVGWEIHRIGVSDHVGFTMRDTTGDDMGDGVTSINDNRWHHVAAVYNGVTKDVYIDGKLDFSQPNTGLMPPNESPILIGRVPQGYANYFSGTIDEIRLYNRALSSSEILYLSMRAVDMNQNGTVNFGDLELFVAEWLANGMFQ